MGYRPRAVRAGLNYDLPLPLMQAGEGFGKRVHSSEIPLQPGVLLQNVSRAAATITMSGLIVVGNPQDAGRAGVATGEVTSIEAEKKLMLSFFNDTDEVFDFYRYIAGAQVGGIEYGAANGTQFYKGCVLQSLHFDNTNRSVQHLAYSISLLVPDGTMWWS